MSVVAALYVSLIASPRPRMPRMNPSSARRPRFDLQRARSRDAALGTQGVLLSARLDSNRRVHRSGRVRFKGITTSTPNRVAAHLAKTAIRMLFGSVASL
jgi:hypothetical protein